MSTAIRIMGDVSLQGTLAFAQQVVDFPENPVVGTFVMKDQALYGYLRIGGLETWYPFASKTNSYIHTQGLPATVWTVNHSLGTEDVWFQVKDANGQIVSVGKTIVDANTFTLNFTSAITGTCVAVAPTTIDVPQVRASSIMVGGGDEVVINSGGVFINGELVLTNASIAADIAAAVAPKADTAYVDAQLAMRSPSDHHHAGVYEPLGAVTAHAGATDPHPQYLTEPEGDARYDAAGAASYAAGAAVSAHEAAGNPHPQYLTQDEGDARYPVLDGAGKVSAANLPNYVDLAALQAVMANMTWNGLPA